jgi:hypothetical protein
VAEHDGTVHRDCANEVRVEHGDGYHSLYYHLVNVGVSNGQHVNRGQYLGKASMTHGCGGYALSVHTHVALLYSTKPLNAATVWSASTNVNLNGIVFGGYRVQGNCMVHIADGTVHCPGSRVTNRGEVASEHTLPPVSGGVALRADGKSGYSVDGYGNIAPFGGAPPARPSATWPGWNIVRGIALRPDGQSGYVLDGWGGLHPFGGAPPMSVSAYWHGWDIARGIVLDADGRGGQVLDGWGGVHPLGNAPGLATPTTWHGWDIARGIALDADGRGGQVLDGWGGLHPFGNATGLAAPTIWHGWDIARGVALLSDSSGYVLDGWGGLHPFGGAPAFTTAASTHPNWDTARGMAGNRCGVASGACAAVYTLGDETTGTTSTVQSLHS